MLFHVKICRNGKITKSNGLDYILITKIIELLKRNKKPCIIFNILSQRKMTSITHFTTLIKKYYETIKCVKWSELLNAPIHTRDLQVKGDANYVAPIQ